MVPITAMEHTAHITQTEGRTCYTVAEFAQLFLISRATVYTMMHEGAVASFTIGGSRRIPVAEVTRLLESASSTALVR